MQGGCFCGAIRYRVSSEPCRVTHCHCVHCRRTSGAPFVTWAVYKAQDFSYTQGRPTNCETRPGVTREFCGECGTQLTYQHRDATDCIDVTAASFDTPEALAPADHVWCDRALPWISMDDGLPRYREDREPEGQIE